MVDVSSWSDFWTMFTFNLGLAVAIFLLFSLIHRFEFFKRLQSCRAYLDDTAPKKPMQGPFSWLIPVYKTTEDQIIDSCGLDAAIYVRMFVFSIQLFFVYSCFCLPILIPINAVGSSLQLKNGTVVGDGVDYLSAGNVARHSDMLWAHWAVLYFITGLTFLLIWRHYSHVWNQRHEFLAEQATHLLPEHFTLLVTDVPEPPPLRRDSMVPVALIGNKTVRIGKQRLASLYRAIRAVTIGLIREPDKVRRAGSELMISRQVDRYFTRLYPGVYISQQGVTRFGKVQKAYKKWKRAVTQLDRARWKSRELKEKEEDEALNHGLVEPVVQHKTGCCGWWGKRVDSIPYWIEQVRERSKKLTEEQQVGKKSRVVRSAFVTVNSCRMASAAAQCVHAERGTQWIVQAAPAPKDVFWANLGLTTWERTARRHLMFVALVALIVFFYIPVTFIAGLASIKNLEKYFPFTKSWIKETWLHGFLTSFVPAICLKICLWIVPVVLHMMSKFEGNHSYSSIVRSTATKHFWLLLFNVFLGYTFAGTLLSQLQAIIDHPQDAVRILASSIPQQSSFFITYTLISSLSFGIELLRMPIPIIGYLIKLSRFGRKIGDREKLWSQGGINFLFFMPYQNLIITFGVVFAVIAPFILPFTLLYSCIGYMVWKHQVLYVYVYPYQSGGLLWPLFIDHVIVALVIGQLTVIGEFGLKAAYYQAAYMIPLPIITLYFAYIVNQRFRRTFGVLPLDLAANIDDTNEALGLRPSEYSFADKYVPDSMLEFMNPSLEEAHVVGEEDALTAIASGTTPKDNSRSVVESTPGFPSSNPISCPAEDPLPNRDRTLGDSASRAPEARQPLQGSLHEDGAINKEAGQAGCTAAFLSRNSSQAGSQDGDAWSSRMTASPSEDASLQWSGGGHGAAGGTGGVLERRHSDGGQDVFAPRQDSPLPSHLSLPGLRRTSKVDPTKDSGHLPSQPSPPAESALVPSTLDTRGTQQRSPGPCK
eukprot:SM000045S16227  [mRNA]  locus=s45:330732:335928:- [translate_table: standard]